MVVARLVLVGADGGACTRRSSSPGGSCRSPAAASAWTWNRSRTPPCAARWRRRWNPTPAVLPGIGPGAAPHSGQTSRRRLVEDLNLRAQTQKDARAADLARQLERARTHTIALFDQLRATLSGALQAPAAVQLTLDGLDPAETQQLERDRRAWQDRLDTLDEARDRELAQLDRRFGDVRELVFPFAVVLAVPEARDIFVPEGS